MDVCENEAFGALVRTLDVVFNAYHLYRLNSLRKIGY